MKMQRNQKSFTLASRQEVSGLLVGALVFLSAPGISMASEQFPPELRKIVPDLDCTPACMTCHSTEPGEAGTAGRNTSTDEPQGTLFAARMEDFGLKPGDVDSVATAYEALVADQAANPEGEENVDLTLSWAPCAGEVVYGCGAQIAPRPTPSAPARAWALLAGLVAAGIGFRRFFRAAK
jgi:hypothetical protein